LQAMPKNEEKIKMTKKVEEDGGELSSIPNEKYQKFFDKFAEINTLPIEQWKVAHLLGYFTEKYKKTYGIDYPWKFNNPNPNKCFEVWQMNTLAAKLSANPKILKDYIDWAYINLVPKAKRRLTSISFMTKDEVLIPYKMNVLLGDKKNLNVDRSAPLPFQYRHILGEHGLLPIVNYGDLAFACQMNPRPDNLSSALAHMVESGFDMETLKRIV
jgi:hypothetical protein